MSDKTEAYGENGLQNYHELMRIYFLEISLDHLTAHCICEWLSAVSLFNTNLTQNIYSIERHVFFMRELAKQGDNYKFRLYLHNNLFQTHCATLEQRGERCHELYKALSGRTI
jgi:hypothetical protein